MESNDRLGSSGSFEIFERGTMNIFLNRAVRAMQHLVYVYPEVVFENCLVIKCEVVLGDNNEPKHAMVVRSACGQEEEFLVNDIECQQL